MTTKCPYCKEEIAENAIKCKHCKSDFLQAIPRSNRLHSDGRESERIVWPAITSLILGILSLLSSFNDELNSEEMLVLLILAGLAIALAGTSISRKQGAYGLAVAGLVTAILSLFFTISFLV